MRTYRRIGLVGVVAVCVMVLTGCHGFGPLRVARMVGVPEDGFKPKVAFKLPDKYNSPDGMTIGPDYSIYLSMNNAGADFKFTHPAKILRITPDDKLEEVITLPPHPETNVASPLGLDFGSDGNLYVSDNQAFATEEPGRSRLLRVVMKDGKATDCEVVATGFNMANGLACHGESLYVCETSIDGEAHPMPSGVYRFRISELDAAEPVKVTGLDDEHLIVKLKTQSQENKVGANGLCFDSKGNLYVCNFGDREVLKVTFTELGAVDTVTVLAKGRGMKSTDGIHADVYDNLWVADFLGNAVAMINTKGGRVTVIAKNEPGDGADGSLDAPSECIRRGNKVYVSNIDITYGPNTADDVHTISVIDLAK